MCQTVQFFLGEINLIISENNMKRMIFLLRGKFDLYVRAMTMGTLSLQTVAFPDRNK